MSKARQSKSNSSKPKADKRKAGKSKVSKRKTSRSKMAKPKGPRSTTRKRPKRKSTPTSDGGENQVRYGQYRKFAQRELERLIKSSKADTQSDTKLLYDLAQEALRVAGNLVLMSRVRQPVQASEFVSNEAQLEILCTELEIIRGETESSELPPEPGITFGFEAGISALDVTIAFCEHVYAATRWNCDNASGINRGAEFEALVIQPDPDKRITEWRNGFMKDMRTKTFPTSDIWPTIQHVGRDRKSLSFKLTAERTRMIGDADLDLRSTLQPQVTAAPLPAGIDRPTRQVPLSHAAKEWFKIDKRMLQKQIEDGSVKAEQLSGRRWKFDLDQVVAANPEADQDADPTLYKK